MRRLVGTLGGGIMLLALLPIVSIGSFLAAFFAPHVLGRWLYDIAFSVLPKVCPADVDVGSCSLTTGVSEFWSWGVWIIVALAFGWATLDLKWTTRAAIACVVVAATIAVIRLAIPMLGGRIYVDAV